MKKARHLKDVNDEDFMSIDEAASVMRVRPEVLRNYLWEGKLTTYKFKTLTLLKADEVKTWKAERQK